MTTTEEGPRQGLDVALGDDRDKREQVIAWTLSYRGDVTLVLKDESTVEGYVFDRTDDDLIRIEPKDGGPGMRIAVSDVRSIRFTGRDTAAGKSFDRWIKTYVEKTLGGETAGIECDTEPD